MASPARRRPGAHRRGRPVCPLVVQPVRHCVVGARVPDRAPRHGEGAAGASISHRAHRPEILAAAEPTHVGGDDRGVHAVLRRVSIGRGWSSRAAPSPCSPIGRERVGVELLLLRQVVGVRERPCAARPRPWPAWSGRRTCGRRNPRRRALDRPRRMRPARRASGPEHRPAAPAARESRTTRRPSRRPRRRARARQPRGDQRRDDLARDEGVGTARVEHHRDAAPPVPRGRASRTAPCG